MVTELEGGLTMKMKKMVGAIALTAALAMGTAPAFAASVGSDQDFANGTGSTEVKVTADASTIHATVPMSVTVVMGASGSGTLQTPDASAYKITNTGDTAFNIVNAELTNPDTAFNIIPMYPGEGGTAGKWFDGNDDEITANSIMITFNDGTNNTYLSETHALKDAKAKTTSTKLNDNAYDPDFKDFTPINLASKNDSVGIKLGGVYCLPDAISGGLTDSKLCSIKYTIQEAGAGA